MIVLMAGLPGTGKSTLARAMADSSGGALLGKDEIRSALFSPEDVEYSVKQDDFVMEVMLATARFLLQKEPARYIFLDGRTFSRSYQIERVLRFAQELSQPWIIIECICSEECARRRLTDDPSHPHPAHNRNFGLYLEIKASFEPIIFPKTTISTDQPLATCADEALAAVMARTKQ